MTPEEFTPKEPVFFLKAKGKSYTLRIPKFRDIAELTRLCHGDLNLLSQAKDFAMIAQVVLFLMSESDRKDFLAVKKKFIDENGIESEKVITGPDQFYSAIEDTEEATEIYKAVMNAIMAYLPKISKEAQSEKKSSELLTGEKSSTLLPASTDTLPISSETLPFEKST